MEEHSNFGSQDPLLNKNNLGCTLIRLCEGGSYNMNPFQQAPGVIISLAEFQWALENDG